MGLDNLVGEDDETDDKEQKETKKETNTSTQSDSSKQFVKITREKFEDFLDETVSYNWIIVEDSDAEEIIYETEEFMFEYSDVSLRIMSTIEKGLDVSREKGDDAIRTVIWSKDADKPIGGRKSTYRIKTWKKNLLNKINSLSDQWDNYVEECPNCNGWLREIDGKHSKFLGCINWEKEGDGCNYRRTLEKPEEAEKKCPNCESGYLIKREGPYGEFLSCSNWNSDGSGCDHTEQLN